MGNLIWTTRILNNCTDKKLTHPNERESDIADWGFEVELPQSNDGLEALWTHSELLDRR